jgi:hypothetical protein
MAIIQSLVGTTRCSRTTETSIQNTPRQGEPDPLWKTIWASRIPAKVKTFLWKACYESLPTKAGLFRRRAIPHPYCDHCHDTNEDTIHALWSCPVLAQVWQSSTEFAVLKKNSHHPFISLVWQVMSLTSHLPLESFAMTCWLLWNKRNQSRLQLPSEEYGNIWSRAQTLLLEHILVSQPMNKENPVTPMSSGSFPLTTCTR